MIIKISEQEVRAVLMQHINSKTDYRFGEANEDNFYFEIFCNGEEIDEIESLVCVCDFGYEPPTKD